MVPATVAKRVMRVAYKPVIRHTILFSYLTSTIQGHIIQLMIDPFIIIRLTIESEDPKGRRRVKQEKIQPRRGKGKVIQESMNERTMVEF